MEQRHAVPVFRKSEEIHPWHENGVRGAEEATRKGRLDRVLGTGDQVDNTTDFRVEITTSSVLNRDNITPSIVVIFISKQQSY
jgi:hypothetical protein